MSGRQVQFIVTHEHCLKATRQGSSLARAEGCQFIGTLFDFTR